MYWNSSSRSIRVLSLACLFGVLLIIIQSLRTWGPDTEWKLPQLPKLQTPAPDSASLGDGGGDRGSNNNRDARCSAFPDPGNIAIAVKTGATEAFEKIPMQMLTDLRCAESIMIFSDLEQEIAGYEIHDALEDIPESDMEGNSDFDFYKNLKQAKKYGQIKSMLGDAHDPRMVNDLAAWTLDKYKNLHMLEKLYAKYPDKDWYIMIDADTYLVWSNLLKWLPQIQEPKTKKWYLGSAAMVGSVQFGHGGSGIVLSQATMYDFAVTHKGVAGRWNRQMHEECCGDYVVAVVLAESGIQLSSAWPTINGEKPITLPFGQGHWCEPVVTMHHVATNEVNQIANFEKSRTGNEILTFADLFHAFVKDVVPDSLDNWNNICKDLNVAGVKSFQECRSACQQDEHCFQFTYDEGHECLLGYSIHLGSPQEAQDGVVMKSGWLRDRIKDWANKQPPCEPIFPFVDGHDY